MHKHGFLVVDKEPGMTSHDVVAIARKVLGTRKVGHAGTLDPMATGILVLGFNNGTRLLQYITGGDKSYQATVVLGAATVTDDVEGEVISTADTSAITDAQIHAELLKMRGTIMQRPSSVSAVKIDGERAYDRVRSGEEVVLPSREVTISQLDVLAIRRFEKGIEIDIEVTCSSGTFIRAIARDCEGHIERGADRVRPARSDCHACISLQGSFADLLERTRSSSSSSSNRGVAETAAARV